jgi:hypothetical protein
VRVGRADKGEIGWADEAELPLTFWEGDVLGHRLVKIPSSLKDWHLTD